MRGSEIRRTFTSFFEERGHRLLPSASLVSPDPSLLLTTAGMVQFIPYFLGHAAPPAPRVTTVQKSFRTTDIDLVGHTARHLTLFEMLGNFSFGDYFKSEACTWARELVTEGYGIEADRLWVTVFETDDEAADIWADEVGIPRDRIVRRGREDNFWWVPGLSGGPCSEVYVDRGPAYGPDGGPAVDEERYLEIWNLVFMQNEVDAEGFPVGDLPKKNIDTGSGLERVAMVLQDKPSFYETDLFRPLLAVAEELAGRKYGEEERGDVSLRILAEHGRATAFLVADGVQPSNEGRGYVLRRMLRRMVSHAWRLGIERGVTVPLAEAAVEGFGEAYPELVENREYVLQVVESEEGRFRATLRQGMVLFEHEVAKPGWESHSGDVAFKLHDTYGFPIELTRELLAEQGLTLDADRFAELMEDQRRRAHDAAKRVLAGTGSFAVPDTEFVGYERLEQEARVLAILGPEGEELEVAGEGQDVRLFLDRTPFYAESGGQVGDAGVIRTAGGTASVRDAQWAGPRSVVHIGRVESGEVRRGEEGVARVDPESREATARSHTATHVVHWTLRNLLGEHARQAGSLVAPGRLRFDFSHHQAVPRDVLEEAEYTANRRLAEDAPVRAYETTMDYAKSQGAIALFGEKYGDIVRVVEIGDYSRELCGGTHVPHTGKVAVVRILGEGSIGSGMRRIEALVGPDALRRVNAERRLLEEVTAALGAGDPDQAPERARRAVERIKQLESELGKIRKGDRAAMVDSLADKSTTVGGVSLVVATLPGEDADGLRELAQTLRSRLEKDGVGAAVLGNADGSRALLVAACTPTLVERGVSAPELLRPAAEAIGGGAGGKPILAFAGGGKAENLEQALATVPVRLEELLRGS